MRLEYLPRLFSGIPLSDGRGEGRIWHAHHGMPQLPRRHRKIPDSLVMSEKGRVRTAIQLVSLVSETSISQVTKRLGEKYADMFVAMREMLHDPSLLASILSFIELQHLDAGSAITKALEPLRKRLSDAPSIYLRERANDLLELQGSLIDALAGRNEPVDSLKSNRRTKGRTINTIAVVETLTPRLVLDLQKSRASGIACERAGPTSHAAILCRAFEIPAVEGIPHILQQLPQGGYAMLDGARGIVGAASRRKEVAAMFRNGNHSASDSEKGIDLSHITLMANLNLAQNAVTALTAGAHGIGLYRTEFEFMVANRLLTKQEQFVRYRNVVIAMMGLPVTIRLLDVAADKAPEIFGSFGARIDSACWGASFLLSRPEILGTQARAISETAPFGPVGVLYPMVADAEQFSRLKIAFCNAVPQESLKTLRHGAMIELPSAVDDAGGIFDEADFACLGTNDLTKHLLNVDRETAVAHGAEIVRSPKLWDCIARVASASSTLCKQLTVCGEMASDLRLLTRFTDLGVRTFSMDIRKIRRLQKRTTDPVSDQPLAD